MTMEKIDERPWYRRPKIWRAAELIFLLVLLVVLVVFGEIRRRQSYLSQAASGQVSLFFKPTESNLPPQSSWEVWVNSDLPVGFAQIGLNFDPALINLTQEIAADGPLSTAVKATSMAEANNSGNIILAMALPPSGLVQPPTGIFRLATLRLAAKTTASTATTVSFDPNAIQVVSLNASVLAVAGAAGAALNLNPQPSSSPTADTVSPQVSFTQPADGAQLSAQGNNPVSATATDGSGIKMLEIFLDGKLQKTCADTASCSFGLKTNKISAGSHTLTAKATDKSAAANWAQVSITVIVRQ